MRLRSKLLISLSAFVRRLILASDWLRPCWVTSLSFFIYLFFSSCFFITTPTGLSSLTFCRIIISPPVTSTILMVRLTGLLSSWHFLHEPRSSSRLKAPSLASCIIHMQRWRHLSRASPLPFSRRKAPTNFFFFWPSPTYHPAGHGTRQVCRWQTRSFTAVDSSKGGGNAVAAVAFITAIKSFVYRVCLLLSSPTLICLSESEGITKINWLIVPLKSRRRAKLVNRWAC